MPSLLEVAMRKKALEEKAKSELDSSAVGMSSTTMKTSSETIHAKNEKEKVEPKKQVKQKPKQQKEVVDPLPPEPEQVKHVDMTVDVMRAIYFMLFKNYDYKTMSKNDLRTRINELIATPSGFGKLLDGLKQFVFS